MGEGYNRCQGQETRLECPKAITPVTSLPPPRAAAPGVQVLGADM